MKQLFLLIVFACIQQYAIAQKTLLDFKIKTPANTKERTLILDAYRKTLLKEQQQDFVFEVLELNILQNYAWLRCNVARKDGKDIQFPAEGDYDCCHAEALLKKVKGRWTIINSAAFSTDVWYDGIWNNKAYPKAIFGHVF